VLRLNVQSLLFFKYKLSQITISSANTNNFTIFAPNFIFTSLQ